MTIGIYKITERASGLIYIGQSIDIERRWKQHQRSKPLSEYDYSVEQECCAGLLDMMEIYFIKKFNTLTPNGLNRCIELSPPSQKGKKQSAEHVANKSAALKGKPKSETHRAALSAANKGHVSSAETIAKRADTLRKNEKQCEHLRRLNAARWSRKNGTH